MVRSAIRRPTGYQLINGALLGLLSVVCVANAIGYPAGAGFDAAEHIGYARGLIENFELPETGAYYTPPLFYALAGVIAATGHAVGLPQWEDGAQVFTGALTIATGVLVLALARLVFPGRRVLHCTALAFYACLPLVYKIGAMVHPQVLVVFLVTLGGYLGARMILRGSFRLVEAVLVGATFGAALLVRNVALAPLAAVLFAVAVVAVRSPVERLRALRAGAVAGLIAVVIAAPWYIHLRVNYDNTVFGRPGVGGPLSERWPARFYVQLPLPEVITAPYRPRLEPTFPGVVYTDTWGDYFGYWSWGSRSIEAEGRVADRLTVQSVAGLLPTALLLAGWLALAGTALRPGGQAAARLLVALVPGAVLLAMLAYTVRNPAGDGDTVKGLFVLPAVPFAAVAFGLALDVLWRRLPRTTIAVGVVLGVSAVASVSYAVV